VGGADREHERVVAGLLDLAAAVAAVAGAGDDEDAGLPQPLHRLVERVLEVLLRAVGAVREADDADPVALVVRGDPLQPRDHRGRVGGAVPRGDLDRQHRGSRRRSLPAAAGRAAVAGDHADHVRPVPVAVIAVAVGGEVHACDDAVAEVGMARHAGVEHGHRHAGALVLGGNLVEPDGLAPGGVGRGPGVDGELARLVAVVVSRRGAGSEQGARDDEQCHGCPCPEHAGCLGVSHENFMRRS
jgi:hypothetical protein